MEDDKEKDIGQTNVPVEDTSAPSTSKTNVPEEDTSAPSTSKTNVPEEDTSKPSTSKVSVSEANITKQISKNMNDNSTSLKELNVLLLGETGVGKSTFINSIGNYLHFKTFDKALNANELLVLINSQFNVIDEDNESHTVILEETHDENEFIGGGQSQTQDVRPYVFPILDNTCKIRLIDTPGMGDTRGFQQDDINCENILNYIANLDELHALCFLLKPTNTRLTPSFKYCLKKILSNLDKSAANNIVFCFTNTRGSNFEPGETEDCLRKFISEIENVAIPFDRNYFCFDNESFKYLAAIKQNIPMQETVIENAQFSWENSTQQALSFMEYIKALKPHNAKNTVCINEARNMITQLSKPLADITECLDANIKQLREHEKILNDKNQSLSDLQKNLHVPTIDLIIEEIDHPATVCTNKSCVDLIEIGPTTKKIFKKKCHARCYLKGVSKEFVGDSILRGCKAMSNEYCRQCECHYSKHMHIYYVTNLVNIQAIDKNVKNKIKSEEDLLKEKEQIITECNERENEMRSEYEIILNTIAKFAHFLKHHAITPFNDAYREYLNYLIQQEEDLGNNKNEELIIALKSTLDKYENFKNIFEEALKKKSDTVLALTPEHIINMRDELFKLKYSGLKIERMFNLKNSRRQNERSYEEFVYNGQTSQKKTNSTNSLNYINIILLGETGVGKSTFINSVANYLQFGDYDKVMNKKQLFSIIPVEFKIQDKFKTKHNIKLGNEDNNEYLNIGDSATQEVKSYVFPLPDSDKRIRLIDTPGLGTRGTFQDDQNCENILGYIGQMGSIHAFCFLFKPTETRLTTAFIYFIKKILTNLNKAAAKNMIFCFTNSRGSNYQAGESEETIKRIIKDIKENSKVEIPYRNNVYYFDNEGFRVMAALDQDVQLTDNIIAAACNSWTVSFNSCISMFKYIIGDNHNQGLHPHNVTSTVCVNEARKNINKLSQPLAEIAQHITNQIRILERRQQSLNSENQTLDDLRAELYIPFINLKISNLGAPATCSSIKSKEALITERKRVTEKIKVLLEEYKEEYKFVIEVTAKFAYFLQTNAITPFNDAHKEYIKQLIINERLKGDQAKMDTIKSLQDSISKHEQIIKVFQDASKNSKTLGNISPNDINRCMQKIFKLKHSGNNIKNMFEAQSSARNIEYTQMEYLHPTDLKGYKQKTGQKKDNQSYLSKRRNLVKKGMEWIQHSFTNTDKKCQQSSSNNHNCNVEMPLASQSNQDGGILIQVIYPNDPTKRDTPFPISAEALNSTSNNESSTSRSNYDTSRYNFGRKNEENYQGKSEYMASTSYINKGNVANASCDYHNDNQRAVNTTVHENTRMGNNSYPMMSNNYFESQSFNQPPITASEFGRCQCGKNNNNMLNSDTFNTQTNMSQVTSDNIFSKVQATNDLPSDLMDLTESIVTIDNMSPKVQVTNDLPLNLVTESIENVNKPSEDILHQPKKKFICKFQRMLQEE